MPAVSPAYAQAPVADARSFRNQVGVKVAAITILVQRLLAAAPTVRETSFTQDGMTFRFRLGQDPAHDGTEVGVLVGKSPFFHVRPDPVHPGVHAVELGEVEGMALDWEKNPRMASGTAEMVVHFLDLCAQALTEAGPKRDADVRVA